MGADSPSHIARFFAMLFQKITRRLQRRLEFPGYHNTAEIKIEMKIAKLKHIVLIAGPSSIPLSGWDNIGWKKRDIIFQGKGFGKNGHPVKLPQCQNSETESIQRL